MFHLNLLDAVYILNMLEVWRRWSWVLLHPAVWDKRWLSEIDWSQARHSTAFLWHHKGTMTSQLTDLIKWPIYLDTAAFTIFTGGHHTRVLAVTLDSMAEDTVAASASLRQILAVSVRYCGPAFVSWLSMLWDTLTQNPELQWFSISPQFWLKVSRGDEGVDHICFPGDKGRSALTRVTPCTGERRASLILSTAAKPGAVYIFLYAKYKWPFGHNYIIDWPGKRPLRAIALNYPGSQIPQVEARKHCSRDLFASSGRATAIIDHHFWYTFLQQSMARLTNTAILLTYTSRFLWKFSGNWQEHICERYIRLFGSPGHLSLGSSSSPHLYSTVVFDITLRGEEGRMTVWL